MQQSEHVLECMWQYMAFFLFSFQDNFCCFSWGDQSSCLHTLLFFCKSLPRLLQPLLGTYNLFKHGRGWQRDRSSPKALFLVMCILTDTHFVAVPSQVEPWEREGIHLFLAEIVVHSELGPFCTLNDMWGPLIVCQLPWFQKDKRVQHSRNMVGLVVIRHHVNCKEQRVENTTGRLGKLRWSSC